MKNRRILSVLLTITMVMAMVVLTGTLTTALAASTTVTVSDWSGMQKAINSAKTDTVIQLSKDIICSKNGGDQIKVDGKTITIDLNGHKLDRNRTKNSGDGHVIEIKGKSTVTLIDSKGGGTITGGYATRGGGINIGGGSMLIFQGGTVTGNQAEWGGGIYVHGTLAMQGGVIKKNTASDSGGGIHVGSDGTIRGCNAGTITENKADNGGGIFNSGSKSVWLRRLKITNNTCSDDGGAIENAKKGTMSLYACTLTGNKTDDEGGGIFNGSDCKLDLDSCTIDGNTAGDEGGGIFNKGPLTMTGGAIKNNTAKDGHGGGIRLWENTATFNLVEVSGNESKNGDGGGFYVGGATLNLDGGIYSNNVSRDDGGAIYTKGTLTVKGNALFEDNDSFNSGGAIRVGGGTATVEGGMFRNNEAGDSGGAIYVNDGTLKLYGGTITKNKTTLHDGGGILIGKDAGVKIHGAPVVKDNDAAGTGDDIYLRNGKLLDCDAKLTSGAMLYVDAEKRNKVFTKNFKKQHSGEDPATYFFTRDGWTVLKKDDEGIIHESNWPILQAQIEATPNWGTLVLDRDFKACKDDAPLFIQEMIWVNNIGNTRALTIDLNGHTIDRALTKPAEGGAVIMNRGDLTIKDSKGGGKITGGYADDDGGGIWSFGKLTLEGVTITGNHCVNDGGGVHCTYKLYIRNSVISNNTAGGYGGGVYNEHDFEMSGSEIKNNTAGKSGGGLVIGDLAEATITSGTITGNTAKYYGGGVFVAWFRSKSNYVPTLNLNGGSITGNKAGLEGGGVLYTTETVAKAKGAPVVDGNTAPIGANLLLREGTVLEVTGQLTDGAKLDLLAQDTTKVLTKGLEASGSDLAVFTYNQGKGMAPSLMDGELYVNLDVRADVWVSDWDGLQKAVNNAKNGQIIGLSKNIYGKGKGRIKVEDGKSITLELNGYTLDRQRTSSDSDGHVIEVKGKSTLTIVDSIGTGKITGGWATRGGGINIAKGSTCVLKGGTITGNKAKWGGGVYAHGTFRMEGGTISGNEAWDIENGLFKSGNILDSETVGSGGGIHCGEEGTLELTGGTISGNTSNDCGGVYNSGSKNVKLSNVTIADNTSAQGGGGFNNNKGGKATLTNCVIRGNTAEGNGGGIWNQEDSSLTLENCTIEDNTANDQGGGVFTKGTLTVTGGAIKNNTAKGKGGGIRLWDGKTTINSGEISGNTSKDQGGGIYVGKTTLNLYGGSITGNKASNKGGGIYVQESGEEDSKTYARINVHGAPVVADNVDDSNLYLPQHQVMKVDGAMAKGAKVSVSLQGLEFGGVSWLNDGYVKDVDIFGHDGVITTGFNTYNKNKDPGDYFTTDIETFSVKLRNDEVLVIESDWFDLQRLIDTAADGSTIVLNRDWFGCDKDDALNIPSGKTLTIDLNGHTVNRGLYKAMGGGAVIMNQGKLTIKDSAGGGKITGGWANDHAGGIWNPGTLILEGGAITGNHAKNNGGGVHNSGTLIVKGGTISNNDAGGNGGGVFSSGTLEISGGEIKNNTAALSGGAVNIAGKKATITGGKLTGNRATKYHGGGIYLSGATLDLSGGEITGNKAAMEGGGLLIGADSTLNVQDIPVMTDNSAPTGANLLIRKGQVINVTGQLADGAKLDVVAQDTTKVLTSGLSANENGLDGESGSNSLAAFTYAEGNVKPALKDGELYVNFDVQADVWVTDWDGLQKAFKNAKAGQVIALSNDISANGKDRIKLEGGKSVTLDLNGCAMNRGRTKKGGDGHVIEVKGKSTLTIIDSRGTGVIKGGWATRGGGINIENGSTCILKGGTVTDNKAEYGGGVYAHGTFKMEGGAISSNSASDSGGGIHCGSEGTLNLTGGKITDNNSSNDCGGVYNSGSKNVTLKNVTISGNTSKQGGGGFNNSKGGTATLTNCVIRDNTTKQNGGGVWNNESSTLTLTNCTVTGNKADDQGGGIYAKGTLTISGGSITGNTAYTIGGGLDVTGDAKTVNINGSLVVKGNTAPRGNNVYINKKTLTVSGAMKDGANVGLFLEADTGVFAKNFGTANPDTDPAKYFFSENGWSMAVVLGDAALIDEDKLTDYSGSFIHGSSQIVSYENVNSRNWMAGISGERRLNEINIPGTHDAAMAKPDSAESLFEDPGSIAGGAEDAQTQIRYIDEQMNDGFRYFDLRLNNKYQKRHNSFHEFFSIDYQDDGKNLWLCHGCNKKGGTYYALNHKGKPTTFDEVLEWAKNFLRKNPSEVIILSIRPETQWDDQFDTIYLRAKKILKRFSKEINPSTNKPYLYMEDGVFGKDYSDYPKLKDVRGQVILRVNHDRDEHGKATLGGIASFGMGGKKYVRPEGGFEETPEIIIQHVNSFYNRYGGVKMPTDALTHLNLLYYVPTNIVEKVNVPILKAIPVRTPIESASDVNPVLFGEGGTFDKTGMYLGWVCMIDRATAYEAARIWRTNFYDMDYVTVTVKSGLSAADLESGKYTEAEGTTDGLNEQDDSAAAKASGQTPEGAEGTEAEEEEGTQTYVLLKGTEITIPQCIYEYDPAETGRDFQSWNATSETENRTVLPGETFIVMEDTTFTGQWLAQGETSVDVVWQDMDDLDGLRADELELQVYPDEDPEHMYTATVTAADGWRTVLEGDVQKIVPVWEHIDAEAENGADTAEGYRYEVADAADAVQSDEEAGEETEVALEGSGLILTLVHTPQGTIAATGEIAWDDYDNRDGLRPETVTLRLMKGEAELDSQTVTAENDWQFDFGELVGYEDGRAIAYSLVEDAISGYRTGSTALTVPAKASVEVETEAEEETEAESEAVTITNVHYPKVTNIVGVVEWNDADNAEGTRPESTTVRLLANGEEIASLVVTKDGADTTLLDVPADEDVNEATEGEPTDETEEEEYEEPDDAEAESDEAEDQPEVTGGEADEGTTESSGEAAETVKNTWIWSFYGVPVYSAGSEVTYTIVQDDVPGYGTEITNEDGVWIANTPLPEMVMLTFDANSGEGEMESIEIDPRTEYALPECGFTAPEGMAFAGWTLLVEAPQAEATEGEAEAAEPTEETETEAEAPTIYSVGDAITFSGNATLTAQWLPIPPTYAITFDGNGGEGAMDAAEPNEEGEYVLPECGFTAPEGMEFVGWKLAAEASEATQEAVEGEEEVAIEDIEEANEGPSIDPDYTYEPGDTITLTANVTAIAQWQEPAKPIVITFDANGGEGEMEAAEADEFGAYTLPENGFTAPEGAEFAGWLIATEAPEADGIEAEPEDEAEAESDMSRVFSAGDVIVVSSDTTVVAQWLSDEPEEAPEGVTITFDANGGEGEMEAERPDQEGNYGLPECAFTAPEGMVFAGWQIGEETWQPGNVIAVTESITAVAQWQEAEALGEEISVTVTMKVVNGTWTDGTTDDKIVVLTGHEGDELRLTIDDLPGVGYTPDEGYAMGSWDTEPSIYVDIEGIELDDPITEDTTYTYTYAVKEEEEEVPSWTIVFDANGGEGEMESVTVEDWTPYALPECEFTAPEGMEFAGWLVSEYVLDPGELLVVMEDIPVTAQWQAIGESPAEVPEGQPTEEQPTEEQPTEEQPTEEQPTEEQPTEEQPTEEQPTEEQPTEEQPTEEQPTEEQPTEEQPTEEQPTEEQPVEEQPVEEKPVEEQPTEEQPTEEQPVEEKPVEEQPTEEKPTEEQAVEAQPVEEKPVEEQPVEEKPAEVKPVEEKPVEEQPVEQQPVEEQPVEEKPAEQKPVEEKPVEAPADAQMCTITFDGGGADGEMAPVQAAKGSQYTLPECAYYIEGCTFSAWTVSANGAEPVACRAGDTITVSGDMTVIAGWMFDEGGDIEYGEEAVEYGNDASTEETGDDDNNGLEMDGEEIPEEEDVEVVEEPEETVNAEPSEVGSVFSGAGIAAIVGAAVLVLGGAGIAIAKKKKRK